MRIIHFEQSLTTDISLASPSNLTETTSNLGKTNSTKTPLLKEKQTWKDIMLSYFKKKAPKEMASVSCPSIIPIVQTVRRRSILVTRAVSKEEILTSLRSLPSQRSSTGRSNTHVMERNSDNPVSFSLDVHDIRRSSIMEEYDKLNPIHSLTELTLIAVQPELRGRRRTSFSIPDIMKGVTGSRRQSLSTFKSMTDSRQSIGKYQPSLPYTQSRKSSISSTYMRKRGNTENSHLSWPQAIEQKFNIQMQNKDFGHVSSPSQPQTPSKARSKSIDISALAAIKHKETHRVVETPVIFFMKDPQFLYSATGEPEHSHGKVNQYHILREIGSGAYGKVVLCKHEETSRYYACKIISKSRLKKKFRFSANGDPLGSIKREIAILKKISKHRNINALVEVLDDGKEDNLYMIFELCEYGPIMQVLINEPVRPFSEILARTHFRDVVLGLEYLHYNCIIHRDIKPENILLSASTESSVQISDFGISHMFDEDVDDPLLNNKNSSPLFSAPETCQTETTSFKGKSVDIWALGITLYCLLHGHCPFQDHNIITLYEKILKDEIVYASELSENAVNLLKTMLCREASTRIKLTDIKLHPWVTNNGTWPMLTTEENCVFEEVTEEEVRNAFKPAIMFFNKKFMNKLKKKKIIRQTSNLLSKKKRSDASIRSEDLESHSSIIGSEGTLVDHVSNPNALSKSQRRLSLSCVSQTMPRKIRA